MFAQVVPLVFTLALCLLFSLSFANKLATIYASRLLQLHIYLPYPSYKLKLSWSRGCEIAESLWLTDTITPDAGPGDSAPGDEYELKWEFDKDSQRYYVSFPDDQ